MLFFRRVSGNHHLHLGGGIHLRAVPKNQFQVKCLQRNEPKFRHFIKEATLAEADASTIYRRWRQEDDAAAGDCAAILDWTGGGHVEWSGMQQVGERTE